MCEISRSVTGFPVPLPLFAAPEAADYTAVQFETWPGK
jgi:hypothetical protein